MAENSASAASGAAAGAAAGASFGPWGAVIGGALGLAGSMFGASKSASSAKKTSKLNYLMMKDQQKWEEQMSNTAHQREMKDLKAAGLNPALTAIRGSGASTPSSGTASAVTPDTSGYSAGANSLINGITAAINSAQTNQRIGIEGANSQAEIALKEAETIKKLAEAGLINKYGGQEAIARINQMLNNASLMAGGAKTANAIGNMAQGGTEALEKISKSIPSMGEKIGNLLYGADPTKETFEQRLKNAKARTAKKQFWSRPLK